jgi:hypothetical protein
MLHADPADPDHSFIVAIIGQDAFYEIFCFLNRNNWPPFKLESGKMDFAGLRTGFAESAYRIILYRIRADPVLCRSLIQTVGRPFQAIIDNSSLRMFSNIPPINAELAFTEILLNSNNVHFQPVTVLHHGFTQFKNGKSIALKVRTYEYGV